MLLFEGFTEELVSIPNRLNIKVRYSRGNGPPILLLHGYPQTSACWHRVAPKLVNAGFSVVVPDLRGYGGSDKPPSESDHSTYSKREMALDQVELMKQFGYDTFYLVGHDRGGRVAHRLALDHPHTVRKLAILDIAPTATMYAKTDMTFATGYYHWFFLIQPAPLPERLISADPEFYLLETMEKPIGMTTLAPDETEAIKEYVDRFKDPACISATCEDYRAAATIDLEHDREDVDQKISCPVLTLWGSEGLVGQLYDVVGVWEEKACGVVIGRSLPCGHYVPEEQPNETVRELIAFFQASL